MQNIFYMIDKLTIDLIFDRADIVEVISDFISLKKSGANYMGNCPFHKEKTPSFTVSPAKRIFKCFGCGKAGNAVGFIMEHESMSYIEALRYLAHKYNIEIHEKEPDEYDKQKHNQREALQILTNFAGEWFKETLHKTEEGKNIGLSYFRYRGFTSAIIEKFQLGYSPENMTLFVENAIKSGYKKEQLVESGLVFEHNNKLLDRFHGRVMFPIHSITGQTLGFGGRVMKNDNKIAKYINSPETLLYNKSHILYGIFHARRTITQHNKCYLVEGYTDVLSMHQSGVENVVASSGTSLTIEQIRLIKRYTKNLTVIYDGDEAGIKASLRGIDMILAEDMNVKVCLLPDGDDPDSFARKKTASEFTDYINENENDFISYKIQLTIEKTKSDPIARAGLINDIIQTISNVSDLITRAVYVKKCSHEFDMPEDILHQAINKLIVNRKEKEFIQEQREEQNSDIVKASTETLPTEKQEISSDVIVTETQLIRILVEYGCHQVFSLQTDDTSSSQILITLAEYVIEEMELDGFTPVEPVLAIIYDIYSNTLKNGEQLTDTFFLQHHDIRIASKAAYMFAQTYTLSNFWKKFGMTIPTEVDKLSQIITRIVSEYKWRRLRDIQKNVTKQLANPQLSDEEADLLMEQLTKINKIKNRLRKP